MSSVSVVNVVGGVLVKVACLIAFINRSMASSEVSVGGDVVFVAAINGVVKGLLGIVVIPALVKTVLTIAVAFARLLVNLVAIVELIGIAPLGSVPNALARMS